MATTRPSTLKRVLEAIVVALPALLILIAVATGTVDLDPPGIFVLIGVLALAAAVYTQHWAAYLALLVVGIGALFATDMIALAFWVIGALYIAIAAANLIVHFTSNRRSASDRWAPVA